MDQLVIREATRDDLPAIESIHVRGWKQGYRDLFPASYLDALQVDPELNRRQREWQPPTPPDRHVVAVRGGQVIGFTFVGAYEADGASGERQCRSDGEIYAIYVDPEHWGQGVGRQLLADAINYLAREGMVPIRLWVLTHNARARKIYEAYGFRNDNMTKAFFRERNGRTVEATETRYTLLTPA